MRWRILLEASGPLPLATAFAVNSAGQMGNMILPARLGDLFRATNLGRAGLSTGFTLATVLAERLLDAGFLVLVSASALTTFSNLPGWLTRSAFLLAIAALTGLAVTVLLPRIEIRILNLIARVVPYRAQPRLTRLAAQFLSGLRSFHHARRASGFLFWTAVIWARGRRGIMVLSHGMGIALSPTEAALVLTSIALASVVPAAPGNLGRSAICCGQRAGSSGSGSGSSAQPGADSASSQHRHAQPVGRGKPVVPLRPNGAHCFGSGKRAGPRDLMI